MNTQIYHIKLYIYKYVLCMYLYVLSLQSSVVQPLKLKKLVLLAVDLQAMSMRYWLNGTHR